jgi:hypothetical protein
VLSDSNGNFNISGDFTCPSSSAIVYITASGGNPGLAPGTNNSAIKLAAPLGICSSLSGSTSVFINEVTTAAMAFAMGQYFTPTFGSASTDSFGAPSTTQAQIGITNAYNTVSNLVNTVTGNAVVTNTLTSSLGTITVTPESAKLYTIADVLAACINSSGAVTGPSNATACYTLFNDVPPASGAAASDTLQAAVYMSLNPTSTSTANMTAVYGLASTSPPYTGLAAQPADWTLGIAYSSPSLNGTSSLFDFPISLAADATGNIWVLNDDTSTAGSPQNTVTELSPTGALQNQVYINTLSGPTNVVIDPSGNLWVPNFGKTTSPSGSGVVEYTTNGTINTYPTGASPRKLASDGKGDIFIAEVNYPTAGSGNLEEIPAGSAAGTTATTIATGLLGEFANLAVDSNYTVWVTGGGVVASTDGTVNLNQFLYGATAATLNIAISGGGGSGATAVGSTAGGAHIQVTNWGSGYTTAPTVTITGGTSPSATATAAITQGVYAVTVQTGGTGYTSQPAVTFTGGGGAGATALANISGGVVTSITVTNPGSGYTSTPTVAIAAPTSGTTATALAATSGVVSGITINTGGSTFTAAYSGTPNTTTAGGLTAPEQTIAIDHGNNIWVTNFPASTTSTTMTVSEIAATASSTISGATNSPFRYTMTATKQIPEIGVMDGSGNFWFANEDTSTTASADAGSVFEVSNAGVLLSPSAGFVKPYASTSTTPIELIGIAIDPSGNVWTVNNNQAGASSTSSANPVVTEIVGAAAPVVTPIAAGLPTTPGGTSKLGTKP